MNGQYSYTEITTQTEAWAEALTAFEAVAPSLSSQWEAVQPTQVVFTGCGSTHYLSLTAATLFQQQTGVPSRACPASELLLFGEGIISDPANTLLVAISRSGTTTETIAAISNFKKQGGTAVWTITCYPDSPMAQMSDIVLPTVAAQEQSVAQTRSFASMLLMAQSLAALIGGKDRSVLHKLPEYGKALIANTEALVQEVAAREEITRFAFLGSGPLFGLANEAMLKMTEMSLTVAQAFHFMEYRHGPMSMAIEEVAIFGLVSPTAVMHEQQVLAEMAEKGATAVSLSVGSGDIVLPADLPTWATPILYLPSLQLLAYHRAIAKGLDPDNPRHLTAVVYLDPAVF